MSTAPAPPLVKASTLAQGAPCRSHSAAIASSSSAVDGEEPPAKVLAARREGDDGHDLRGGGDDKACLTRDPVRLRANRNRHAAKGAIVHIHGAGPGNARRVEIELVAEK